MNIYQVSQVDFKDSVLHFSLVLLRVFSEILPKGDLLC